MSHIKNFAETKKETKYKKMSNKVNNKYDLFTVIYDVVFIQCDYIRNLNKKGKNKVT